MRVILSRSAADYLRQETMYLKRRNPSAAAKFTSLIRDAVLNLQRFPDLGTEKSQLPVPGARTWVAGDYLLDYARNGDCIEIVNIRHGRMKPLTPDSDIDNDLEADFENAPAATEPK